MPTITLIGANGHVGTELTLLLSMTAGVDVVPLVRSHYAGSYLRQLGIDCRIGTVAGDDAPSLLRDADLVVDLALPQGLPSHVRRGIRTNMDAIFRHAPAGAQYVFVSSVMAYGVDAHLRFHDHLFANTTYGASKRYGEKRSTRLGRLRRRPVSILRLGEVHGDLQPVSHGMSESVAEGRPFALPERGVCLSDAIFCATIAATLRQLVRGDTEPGAYTLVEDPPLSLRELYEVYARARSVPLDIEDSGSSAPRSVGRGLRQLITANRELLTAQLLPAVPPLEQRLRAQHHVRTAGAEIAKVRRDGVASPPHRHGVVPGARVSISAAERDAVTAAALALRQKLHDRFGARSHLLRLDDRTPMRSAKTADSRGHAS